MVLARYMTLAIYNLIFSRRLFYKFFFINCVFHSHKMKRKLPNWLLNLDDEDVLTDSESSDRPHRKCLQTNTNNAESTKSEVDLEGSTLHPVKDVLTNISFSDYRPDREPLQTINVESIKTKVDLQGSNDSFLKENQAESNSIVSSSENTTTKRYSLRSSQVRTILNETDYKPKSSSLPFIEYKGQVEYYTEMHDIAIACDSLMTWVDKQQQEIVPIGFDMEWPFTFQTGSGKSAVIQLCADINVCYVFHISRLKKLPAALVQLLQHPKVRLHGVNIKNDCRKLERDFKEVNSQLMIDHCRDLGVWCNEVINSSGRWSMSRLVLHICKLQINKDRKVRMSSWHIQPLTKEQQIYAAIDVYIAQVIYYELEKREKERDEKTKAFAEKYGDETLNAIAQLS